MVCLYCAAKTEVINSRPQKRLNQVWRRRQCQGCGAIFSTEETPGLSKALVVATGGQVRPFLADKLFLSLYASCRHRATAITDARALTQTIIAKMLKSTLDGNVTSEAITETAQEVLGRFDKAAHVHYKAFHPEPTPR